MNKKVSIITVVYNNNKFIRKAIDSVLKQDYPSIEYIIIDGGSTDGTIDIINEYKDQIALFISEPDNGIYDGINKGISHASGSIIGLLHSDDFYPNPHVISDVMESFTQLPEIEVVLGNVDFVDPEDLANPIRFYSSFKFEPWKMRFGFMPAHPASFIKKSVYEQVGLYKLGYEIAADFDMFLRMFMVNKLSFSKLNKTLVRMRIGGVSTSGWKSYITSTKEMQRSLDENRIYSNILMVLIRLPVKFVQKVKSKIGG
ncbi:MAG: glycosyltransferase [Methylophaga sp.]|nr:glycosyltransferase [Methylophaga sp.]